MWTNIVRVITSMSVIFQLFACGSNQGYEPRPAPEGSEYYLSIFGDSRDGNHIYSRLQLHSIMLGKPLASIHLGDMISNPQSAEQWPYFVALTHSYVNAPNFYPVIGNHDVSDTQSLDLFLSVFPQLGTVGYRSALIGDCFCVFLNSESLEVFPGHLGPTQEAWLAAELASAASRQARFRLIFMHRPLFPQNHHIIEKFPHAAQLHELFRTYKVTAVIASHEHSYTRIDRDGIPYVISGGAGSPLYAPAGVDSVFYHFIQVFDLKTELQFRVIDFKGVMRDEFSIQLSQSDPDPAQSE